MTRWGVRLCCLLASCAIAVSAAHAQPDDGMLNLNKADFKQLRKIGFSTVQANNLLRYRQRQGPLPSVDDLVRVRGFSGKFVDAIRAYAYAGARPSAQQPAAGAAGQSEESAPSPEAAASPGGATFPDAAPLPPGAEMPVGGEVILDANMASLDDLVAVPGMSEKLAQAIVSYRESRLFTMQDDLKKVPGMTEEKFGELKGKLSVPPSAVEYFEEGDVSEEGASFDAGVGGENKESEGLGALREEPIDVNTAAKDELLKLPAMTSVLADAIINYRKERGLFASTANLRRVPGMTESIFLGMQPYVKVTLAKKKKKKGVEIGFKGRIRVHADPPDYSALDNQFKEPLYIYTKDRLFVGKNVELGFLAFRRNGEPALTLQHFVNLNMKKYWMSAKNVSLGEKFKLDRLVIGTYQLCYGQGLIFYDDPGELVRPVKVNAKGMQNDDSTGANFGLRGFATTFDFQKARLDLFFSHKSMGAKFASGSNGSFNDTPLALSNDITCDLRQYVTINGEGPFYKDSSGRADGVFKETLFGGRWQINVPPTLPVVGQVAVTGYKAWYNKPFVETSSTKANPFKSTATLAIGTDFDVTWKRLNFFGEFTQTWQDLPSGTATVMTGNAMVIGQVLNLSRFTFSAQLFNYDPDFFNRFTKGVPLIHDNPSSGDVTRNELGVFFAGQYRDKKNNLLVQWKSSREKGANYISGSSAHSDPERQQEFYFEYKFFPWDWLELYFREIDNWDSGSDIDGESRRRIVRKSRYQVTWTVKQGTKLKFRWDMRKSQVAFGNTSRTQYFFVDIRQRVTRGITVNFRYYAHEEADGDMSSSAAVEPYWKNVLVTQGLLPGNGHRFFFIVDHRISKNFTVWMKYENAINVINYPSTYMDTAGNASGHSFKLQTDFSF